MSYPQYMAISKDTGLLVSLVEIFMIVLSFVFYSKQTINMSGGDGQHFESVNGWHNRDHHHHHESIFIYFFYCYSS
jgi:hypothetical protein